ncbi:MAG: hypothetical protein KJ915_05795 [Candidatus Omnitrophica bacterium]|nr:hypothetical protein [Candidatus Omnitrophota bacterium]
MKYPFIYICTQNKSKFDEYLACFEFYKYTASLFTRNDVDLTEPKSLSLEEVAINKATQAYSILKKPVLTDDTGLFLSRFPNFPGTYTKFLSKTLGIDYIYKLISESKSTLCFKIVLCFYNGLDYEIFNGTMKGTLNHNFTKSSATLSYNDLFIPDGKTEPLSEIPLSERIKISHRSKAIKKFVDWLNI